MVVAYCRQYGLTVREAVGGYGVVALEVDGEYPWLAFRADMDALPIQEREPRSSYASQIDGVSHSCGHDAHTSIMLGVVRVISRFKASLNHNIVFIFQPAEETCEGAAAMLREQLFGDFQPEQIYALHVYPYLPAGSIGLRKGAMCAAADMFDVEIKGHGGHAGNVMPESIFFSGTIRSLHAEVHEEIRARMDYIIRQTAETWGARARFTLRQATPVLINDTKILRHATDLFTEYIPDVNLIIFFIRFTASDLGSDR